MTNELKLNNGYKMKLGELKGTVDTTYMQVTAHGYHGDMDYEVNNDCKVDFNTEHGFKDMIAFSGYLTEGDFEYLKEDIQAVFKDEDEYYKMVEEWDDFATDYSECHDERITLNLDYYFVVEGKIYSSAEFDFFKDGEE